MENVHELSIEIPEHVTLLWLGCFPGHQQRLAPCCAQESNHRPARQSLKRSETPRRRLTWRLRGGGGPKIVDWTYIYLVGGLEHFFIFPYIGNNHPN